MNTLETLAAGGVLILTTDMCKQIDASMQRAMDQAVQKGIEIARQLNQEHDPLIPYKKAMQVLDIKSANTLRAWQAAGILHVVKKGSRCYIPYEDIANYKAANK